MKIKGIEISILQISLGKPDGYGISVGLIKVSTKPFCYSSVQKTLFTLMYQQSFDGDGGWEKCIFINLFWFLKKKIIIRRLIVINPDEFEEDF